MAGSMKGRGSMENTGRQSKANSGMDRHGPHNKNVVSGGRSQGNPRSTVTSIKNKGKLRGPTT